MRLRFCSFRILWFRLFSNLKDPGHRSGIEPDVSLSKIYVRDFEELASAFVRFARVRFARVRSLASDLLASDLLAWRESFLLKRSSVSFISKIRQKNKDQ